MIYPREKTRALEHWSLGVNYSSLEILIVRLLGYQADFEADQPLKFLEHKSILVTMKKFLRTTDLILLWDEEFLDQAL